MNAYELADEFRSNAPASDIFDWCHKSAIMLRQQADRIAELEKQGFTFTEDGKFIPPKDYVAQAQTKPAHDFNTLTLDTGEKRSLKPLSDEEIWDIINNWEFRQDIAPTDNMFLFARAIEAKVWE